MQDNFIKKISPIVRIIILLIHILCLLMAKSIFLILFITTLTLILFLITNEKINIYIKTLKKIGLLLLIYIFTYIIMFRYYNALSIVILLYKSIVIVFLIKIFLLNTNFREMHEGIYGLLLPFKRFNIEKFSLTIVMSLYYIKCLSDSFDNVKRAQILCGKRKFNIKNYFLPAIICSINKLNKKEENLKIEFYKLNYKNSNMRSKILLVLFIVLFIVCIIKEVVL